MFLSAWVPEEIITAQAVLQHGKETGSQKQTFYKFVGLIQLKYHDNQRVDFKKEKPEKIFLKDDPDSWSIKYFGVLCGDKSVSAPL